MLGAWGNGASAVPLRQGTADCTKCIGFLPTMFLAIIISSLPAPYRNPTYAKIKFKLMQAFELIMSR